MVSITLASRGTLLRAALMGAIAILWVASCPGAEADALKARQLAAKFRAARQTKPRVELLKQLVAAGPEGRTALKTLLDKELQQAQQRPGRAPDTAALDAEIAKLRQGLADLRKSSTLTKEQLQATGLPALEQLGALVKRRMQLRAAYQVKVAAALERLGSLAELVRTAKAELPEASAEELDDFLARAARLAGAAVSPEERAAKKVFAANAALAGKLDAETVAGMNEVNEIRMICGLKPLVYDLRLCVAAAGHSADMRERGFFAHDSPVEGKETPWKRAERAGTTANGENIYNGSPAARDAVRGWFLSPPHHRNLFGEGFSRQGLGHAGKLWTQMFGN